MKNKRENRRRKNKQQKEKKEKIFIHIYKINKSEMR